MRKWIRYMGMIAVCCLLLFQSGCSCENQTFKIALLVKSTETEYWNLVRKGAEAFAGDNQVELVYCGPEEESDCEQQLEIFQRCVDEGMDAVLLAASDYYLFEEPVEEAGIPVILIDCPINGDGGTAFVGTDNYEAGSKLAGEFIARNGGEGTLAVVSFMRNTGPAIEREAGFRDTIEKNSEITMLETRYCDSDVSKSQEITEELLRENQNITMVAGLNAQSLMGVATAVSGEDFLSRELFLGGIDCLADEVDYIEDDIIDVCILQNPYMMGYYGVQNAWKSLKGMETEKKQWVETYVVDKKTVFEKKNQELIFPFDS